MPEEMKDKIPYDKRIDELEKYLQRSGLPLNIEISSFLNDDNWQVNDCVYFVDQEERNARELDILATKIERIGYSKTNVTINSRKATVLGGTGIDLVCNLIIECKKSEKPQVFYQKKKNLTIVLDGIKYWSGRDDMNMPTAYRPLKNDFIVFSQNWIKKNHHYFDNESFSILFEEGFKYNNDNKDGKGNKVFKYEFLSKTIFEAVIKVIKFTDNKIAETNNRFPRTIEVEDIETLPGGFLRGIPGVQQNSNKITVKKNYPSLKLFYPIIILEGDMFEVDIINGKPKCKPIEYTKYFINYQSPVIKGIFVIDIVSKNYIRDFIKKINLDITNIANRIQQNILSMAKK